MDNLIAPTTGKIWETVGKQNATEHPIMKIGLPLNWDTKALSTNNCGYQTF